MKSIDYFSHTADVRMKLTADSLTELFEAALSGMNQMLKASECDRNRRPTKKRVLKIKSPDVTSLLVEFMNQVLGMSYASKAIFCSLHAERLFDGQLVGYVTGVDVPEFDEDIKAVTYHEADIRTNAAGRLETMIVFDI